MSTTRSFIRGLVSGLETVLVVALLALLAVLVIIPKLAGGASLTVLTGSMEPGLSPGDIAVVRGVDDPAEVKIGDVVTFMPNPDDPTLITHRVVAKTLDPVDGISFTTRGDANSADDEPISGNQIRGVMMYSVPYLGQLRTAIGGNSTTAVSAAGVALIGFGAFSLLPRRRSGRTSPTGADTEK